MKTILVPTDFSANAINALYYALQLARLSAARVYILHVYHLPMVAANIPASVIDNIVEELDRELQPKMTKLLDRLYQEGYADVEGMIKMGYLADELINVATHLKADLVVMGTKGVSSFVDEFLGSNTAAIIERQKFPVLAIPFNASYQPVTSMVLATDYHPISNPLVLNPMLELAAVLDADINVLYVDQNPDEMNEEQRKAEAQLESLLVDRSPNFYYSAESDVFKGINEFIKEENAGMLVMISRKKSFLQQLFSRSHTRYMAYHSAVPLLVLPDKEKVKVPA